MSDTTVSDDVREFIQKHIDSVGQLEALLLLRAYPQQRWNVSDVAKRLYTGEQETREFLRRLCEDGLADCTDHEYWFTAREGERKATLDKLAEVYARQLIPVTNLIHSKSRRIREFANAFRLRKDS